MYLLSTLAAATLLIPVTLPAPGCSSVDVPLDPDAYRDLWEAGRDWDGFRTDAEARRDLWVANWEQSERIDPELIERVRAVPGVWRVLAVAVDGCSDSVNTIPFLARLAERAGNVELRIVAPDAAAWVMDAHPTPDGRPATPTVILLDGEFEERGCFVERPTPLQRRILENPDGLAPQSLYEFKMGWYADDAGRTTVEEFVEILEGAASGDPICG